MILFVVGTLAVVAFLAWGTYRTAQVLHLLPPTQNLLLLPVENVARLVLIGVCLAIGQASGIGYKQLGWTSLDLRRDLLLGGAVGIAVAAVLPPLTVLAVRLFGKQIYSPVVVLAIMPRSPAEWGLVPLALVPAVFLEELVFRSYLVGGFGLWIPPLVIALVASAAVGVMHLPQGSFSIVAATGMGLLLSVLFIATYSLVAPLVAHYIINLLQLIWASFDRSLLESYERTTAANADPSSHF